MNGNNEALINGDKCNCKEELDAETIERIDAVIQRYPREKLVGIGTAKTPRSESFELVKGCCAYGAALSYRSQYPRRKFGHTVFIEGDYAGSRHRVFSGDRVRVK